MDIAPSSRLALLRQDWTFSPTTAAARVRMLRRVERLRGRTRAPEHRIIKAPPPGDGQAWTIYFVYLPDGILDPAHRFALDRLRMLRRRLMVVCAAPDATLIPADLADAADAMVWKALPGFDFSAYAIGLHTLARYCPGADALVLNDSTFGPLVDLSPWLERARWDLTGFTATANVENHIQSYAFHLRDVTPTRLEALAQVLPAKRAYDRFWAVVLNQETRFARIAARSMSVGAFLFSDRPDAEDPMLQLALPLVSAGFPFLKRSLLGKLSHLASREAVLETLAAAGYPS